MLTTAKIQTLYHNCGTSRLSANLLSSENKHASAIVNSHVPNLVPLYTAGQLKHIEQLWFDGDNSSYGLMQQAAWQMASWIEQQVLLSDAINTDGHSNSNNNSNSNSNNGIGNNRTENNRTENNSSTNNKTGVAVWVGSGNNGGDGWLLAGYLAQMGAEVIVIEVGRPSTKDSKRAKKSASNQSLQHIDFSQLITDTTDNKDSDDNSSDSDINNALMQRLGNVEVMVDALFGIGLTRRPEGNYKKAIGSFNAYANQAFNRSCSKPYRNASHGDGALKLAIDMPSGLVADTGQVFDNCAVRADVTLCLVARKVGLHIKDGDDYSGDIVDMPLIPTILDVSPTAYLQRSPRLIQGRKGNTHKGSFGNVLIMGGNQVDGSQGMGGASVLASASAFAAGVGKLTVACHKTFHGSVLTSLPNAMTIDLHDKDGVTALLASVDTAAIGMGFGRDDTSRDLFETYLHASMEHDINLIIDADGLYHLAMISRKDKQIIDRLNNYATKHTVFYTPHSGEAARLLDVEVDEVEADRLAAIKKLSDTYAGAWLLKGAGSIVLEDDHIYVCAAGNAGMASAGMGDVLSGLSTGLMAQTVLPKQQRSLIQAVMIHAVAGDVLQDVLGEHAMAASDMPAAIGTVIHQLTQKQDW